MILSLGSINADFQVRTRQPVSAGQTQLASDFVRLGGGKAANVAYLAHRLGHSTLLLGRVGSDDLREQALAALRRAGLDLDRVTIAQGSATSVSMIAVAPDGKKTIILAPNANDSWDEPAARAAAEAIETAPASAVLVLDFEISPAVAIRAIETASARGLRIVLDPAPAERVERTDLAKCTALSPDAHEAAQLTGIGTDEVHGAARAAETLAGLGPKLVCVKLSDGGCVFAEGGRLCHVAPTQVDIVDSTGAGDAFTAALSVALAEERPTDQAVLFATAASHLAVTRYGSQESYPAREEIEKLMSRLAPNLRPLAA